MLHSFSLISLQDWEKGVIFVNGFNLGRYWKKGPQLTYYLPGPLLRTGKNEVGCADFVMFLLFKIQQRHQRHGENC